MKRILFGLLLLAAPAWAQEATLNSPVTRSSTVAKVKIDAMHITREPLGIQIALVYQDSGNVDIPASVANLPASFAIPSAAGQPCTSATTINGFTGAMNAARGGETGSNARIQQFRMLGYLVDQGCLSGVTLVP